jgi:hypothetical protein
VEALHVEAARIPDRDRLLRELEEHGLEAHVDGEVGLAIPCVDAGRACDEVLSYVEDVVMRIGAPFVPIKHDGVIYVRPPLS